MGEDLMREFIYFSQHARTSGNFDDLMKAGRMDIVCHVIINSFFISNKIRNDVKLHLIFYGPPDPPKHLEMIPGRVIPETGKQAGKEGIDISKKDLIGLIKRMLFKYKHGIKHEVYPGYFIEKKGFWQVLEELQAEGKKLFVLDDRGEDIRKADIPKDCVFILGDHQGLPHKELKRLKKIATPVSVGPTEYFASQVVTLVQNELDRRGV